MAVPQYQQLMVPVLIALKGGVVKTNAEVSTIVAALIDLDDEDRRQKTKGGRLLLDSRVSWAITYLTEAKLISKPRRAVNAITERGEKVLCANPEHIDNDIIRQFPEFLEFLSRARASRQRQFGNSEERHVASAAAGLPMRDQSTYVDIARKPVDLDVTPTERIDGAVQEHNAAVASELLARVLAEEPVFLERLVLRLMTAMGYGGNDAAEHLGRSGDEGLDGVIKQDPLGLDRIYLQAKRYAPERTIGRPDIQAFVGALHGAQSDRGVFITTSRFSSDAIDYAEKVQSRIILIDGHQLAALLVQHNIGAQDSETYVLKRLDEDFFLSL